jgi:hypothetical protein
MASGLNVSALADFNNQIAGELLLKLVYGGSTIEYVTVQEGVKYLEPINLFEVSLYMNNGTCVSSASGSATFTQRNIQVCPRTSFDALCLKDLDTKYLGISSLDRGSYNETWALLTLTLSYWLTNSRKLTTCSSGTSFW